MANPQRHIGRMARTDQRLVVIFMQIPDRDDHALIVSADSLPPRFEQALMQVVTSNEGQSAQDLGTVLARRLMPDTNVSLLTTLHNAGLLQPVPVDNIIMFPLPNQPYPLRQILQSMGRTIQPSAPQVPYNPYGDPVQEATPYAADLPYVDPNSPQFLAENAAPVAEPVQYDLWGQPIAQAPVDPYAAAVAPVNYQQTDKFNPHVQNQNHAANARNSGIANGLLIEAQMLDSEAKRKREEAYKYAPELRPAPPVQQPAPSRTLAPAPAPKAQAKPRPTKATATAEAVAKPRRAAPKRTKA